MIEIVLPLPPSKNKRTERKGYYNRRLRKWCNAELLSDTVLTYREEVALKLARLKGRLPAGEKIVVECVWYRPDKRMDVHNFHAELADAVAPALGLDDKWFLIRDMDMVDVPKGEGRVWVQMRPTGKAVI